MKKLLCMLLALVLLSALPLTAAAGDIGDPDRMGTDDVPIRAAACSAEPGADGSPRLTVSVEAANRRESACLLRVRSCEVGGYELPAAFSLRLEPGESGEEQIIVPLAPLTWLGTDGTISDYIRLSFLIADPATEEKPVETRPVALRIGGLPELARRGREGDELLARFGVRLSDIGAEWGGNWLTAWFLLENNNDFPVALAGSLQRDGNGFAAPVSALVQGHSRAAFRADLPLQTDPAESAFTLKADLKGAADGPDYPAVGMASVTAPLRLGGADGNVRTISPAGESELLLDQNYVNRVGYRSFRYDESVPMYVIDPDMRPLPAGESGLVPLACCGAYEILAGEEKLSGAVTELPVVLRNFTETELLARIRPGADGLWLPCLPAGGTPVMPANGCARDALRFDAEGLAFTELAGLTELRHSFTLRVETAAEPAVLCGEHPVERVSAAAAALSAETPCVFDETPLGELSFRLLGLRINDGFSVWLQVRNSGETAQRFGAEPMQGILNGTLLQFCNSGSEIPAHADCLVLLRAADAGGSDGADPFAFKTPPLSDLNTLKLRLDTEEGPKILTLMFQHNGNILFASAA